MLTPTARQFALSATGYAITAVVLGFGLMHANGGDARIWDRVGDEMRAGVSPYYASEHAWFYAPPLAVLLALVTWLPLAVQAALLFCVNVAAIRYMAGSWLRVGYWCLCPLVAFELLGGQINFLMGAAMLAAVRGVPVAAAIMAAAKLSPILTVDRRQWRTALLVGLMLVALTLPVLDLWPQWVSSLVGTWGRNVAPGAQLLIPFLPRLAVAVGLVAMNRPWSRMAAGIVAIPALYIPTLLLLLGVPWPKVLTARREAWFNSRTPGGLRPGQV